MDDNEYNLAAQCQLLQDVHDVLAVPAGQATGGFIHKQHSGLTNQFQGNVQSLALSARNRFVHHGTHAEVSDFPQAQATKGQLNALQSLRLCRSPQTQFSTEFEVFIHRQFADQDILLSNVTQASLRNSVIPVNGVTIQVYFTKRRLLRSIQDVQQRGFAGTTRAHDANQISRLCFDR